MGNDPHRSQLQESVPNFIFCKVESIFIFVWPFPFSGPDKGNNRAHFDTNLPLGRNTHFMPTNHSGYGAKNFFEDKGVFRGVFKMAAKQILQKIQKMLHLINMVVRHIKLKRMIRGTQFYHKKVKLIDQFEYIRVFMFYPIKLLIKLSTYLCLQ